MPCLIAPFQIEVFPTLLEKLYIQAVHPDTISLRGALCSAELFVLCEGKIPVDLIKSYDKMPGVSQ